MSKRTRGLFGVGLVSRSRENKDETLVVASKTFLSSARPGPGANRPISGRGEPGESMGESSKRVTSISGEVIQMRGGGEPSVVMSELVAEGEVRIGNEGIGGLHSGGVGWQKELSEVS